MIVPDLNLLIYAYNLGAPHHVQACRWWEDTMNGQETVGLPVAVATGFIRLMTNPKVIQPPMQLADAVAIVKSWVAAPNVVLLQVSSQHWDELARIGWTGPALSDAHLAALAIEHSGTLHSNDNDFQRCPGLRWENPIAGQI